MKNYQRLLSACVLAGLLSSCDNSSQIDPKKQTGADPELPKAQNFLMPPMKVPEGIPWKNGEMPKVADGLKIEKIAEGLKHPRQVYVLPNNDVLVAESNGPVKKLIFRPKELIMGMVQKSSGKGGEAATALRCCVIPGANGRNIRLSRR